MKQLTFPMIKKFNSLRELIDYTVTQTVQEVQKAINSNGLAYLGLSGGSTPGPIYQKLGQYQGLDWSKTQVYLMDERYVELDSPKSNFSLINSELFRQQRKKSAPPNFHFPNTNLSLKQCAADYGQQLAKIPHQELDLVMLGMGPDGHFASIFPGFTAFDTEELALITENDNFAIRKRITVCPRLIMKSKRLLILIRGAEKKLAFQEFVYGTKTASVFPAHYLKAHPNFELLYAEIE